MELKEFCKSLKILCSRTKCLEGCPIWNESRNRCDFFERPRSVDESVIEKAEKWINENPIETRGQALKRIFKLEKEFKGCEGFNCVRDPKDNEPHCSTCQYHRYWSFPYEGGV